MIDVTCAVIRNEDDEVLVVQRGELTDHPGKWEFPGGKIIPGESAEECIIREIREELSFDIVICKRLNDVEHDYGIKKIRLIPFVCDTLDDVPFLSEHVAYKWLNVNKLTSVDFSEADIFVANEYIEICGASTRRTVEHPGVSAINEEEIRSMVERIMGTKEAQWLAASVIANPVLLKKFIDYSFSQDKKLAFHASWILTKVCDRDPEIIYPHIHRIIDSLDDLQNESALRSFLRIISLSDPGRIDAKHQGLLADLCFRELNSGFSAIAVKAYSMEILYRLTLVYPELATELALSVRSVMDLESAGIVSRANQILKKLNK